MDPLVQPQHSLQRNNETSDGKPKPSLTTLQEKQDDKEMVSDDFEREKVEARKKSDSVSKARPVSTTSIGSVRHDSVSKRAAAGIGSIAEGEGGDESQVPVEVQSQVAEESSSTHSRFPRNKRKASPIATEGKLELGSSTHSSPLNSVSSYNGDYDQDCPCGQEQITVSAESISAITQRISVLEETVCELSKDRVRVRELEEEVRTLREELIVLSKSDTKKTELHQGFTASLNTVPEQDEKQAEISRNHDPDSVNPDVLTNVSKVEITCEAQASTKTTNSPPFFSDSGNSGYQMCITLSRNDHIDPELKFSLVIMRSKKYKELPWPFRREVRVTCVHNVDQSKDNVLMIKPRSEKSFQRPKSDLNEPFVFLQKHYSGLFDGGFISNDDKVNFLVNVT